MWAPQLRPLPPPEVEPSLAVPTSFADRGHASRKRPHGLRNQKWPGFACMRGGGERRGAPPSAVISIHPRGRPCSPHSFALGNSQKLARVIHWSRGHDIIGCNAWRGYLQKILMSLPQPPNLGNLIAVSYYCMIGNTLGEVSNIFCKLFRCSFLDTWFVNKNGTNGNLDDKLKPCTRYWRSSLPLYKTKNLWSCGQVLVLYGLGSPMSVFGHTVTVSALWFGVPYVGIGHTLCI